MFYKIVTWTQNIPVWQSRSTVQIGFSQRPLLHLRPTWNIVHGQKLKQGVGHLVHIFIPSCWNPNFCHNRMSLHHNVDVNMKFRHSLILIYLQIDQKSIKFEPKMSYIGELPWDPFSLQSFWHMDNMDQNNIQLWISWISFLVQIWCFLIN